MAFAFTFPGQGSQSVGMGEDLAKAFPAARRVFDEVDEALGQKLSELMFKGPMEDLTLTTNTQPALMACSVAAMQVLKSEFDVNATGQIVLSGEKAAVEAAAEAAREMGIRKAVMLPVSAPFHCDMMQPAADAMRDALADVTVNAPAIPLINNVTAQAVTDPDQIRADLVTQVTGRVRWRESIEWMASEAGIETFAEPGTGKVLTVMLRRIVKGVQGTALNSPEALEAFATSLKG